jgi:dTDP-glucose 4,6-dehydratase
VLHLAAESHVDRSIATPPQFVQTNVLGTCVLLDEATRYWRSLATGARQSFRFVLVSTDEVFGSAADGEVFDAESPLAPSSPYAASKAAAEHLARSFMHTYGLPVITVNPTNNYGPRQLPEKLIPRMILAASRRHPLPLYGDGLQERDWLHVDDCCRGISIALERGEPGTRYPMGAGNQRTNESVVEAVCDLLDQRFGDGPSRRGLIQHVQDRPGHDRRYAVDSSRLHAIGWSPRVDFQTGLAATVDWYLENDAWVAEAEESLRGSNISVEAE